MRFHATFSRQAKSLPVVGELQRAGDELIGAFRFSTHDASTIRPGAAKLTLHDGSTLAIFVRSTQTTSESTRGRSQFRVLQYLS
jgi:hypothetical protein